MKALVADDYGPPEVLAVRDVPAPRPGPGQIQVRIRAAGLNPADLRTLSGVMRDRAPLDFPYVPGSDFAGTVPEAGPGVTRFATGDEIFGLGFRRTAAGIAALVSDPPSLTTERWPSTPSSRPVPRAWRSVRTGSPPTTRRASPSPA